MLWRAALALVFVLNIGPGVGAVLAQAGSGSSGARSCRDNWDCHDITSMSAAGDVADDGADGVPMAGAIADCAPIMVGCIACLGAPGGAPALNAKPGRGGWVLGRGCQSNC
jgi:hypothetical protein